jgi:hypothetical protein
MIKKFRSLHWRLWRNAMERRRPCEAERRSRVVLAKLPRHFVPLKARLHGYMVD